MYQVFILKGESGIWERFTSNGFFEGELFDLIPGLLEDNDGYFWFRQKFFGYEFYDI